MPFGVVIVIGFFVMVTFMIIASVVSASRQKKAAEDRHENYEETVENEGRVTQFVLKKEAVAQSSQKRTSAPAARAKTMAPTIKPSQTMTPTIKPSQMMTPKIKSGLTIKTPHTHPAESGKYRTEVVDMGGSLGGTSTEGCAEHYFTRFVKIDEVESADAQPNTELIKAIVIGSALEHPRFKK